VAVPSRADVVQYSVYTGTTRAIESTEVRARASGTLEKMHYQPRGFVEKNQLLFSIEPDAYRAARDAAAAQVKSAEAELARAESDLKRIEIAIRTRAVSESDLDLARARRDQAAASVLAAKATLDKAELDLSYTEVRAPIGGQVARNEIDPGNLVNAGQATLLTTINRLQPMHVYFDVPEAAVLRFLRTAAERGVDVTAGGNAGDADGAKNAHVATAADDGFPHAAVIDYIDNEVDAGTGTIEVRAVLGNEDLLLVPGLFVRVRIAGEVLEDAIVVPEKALGTDLNGKYVLVVGDDGIVEARYVAAGPRQDDGTVAIVEGLDGGERIIVEGLLKARPGLPVTPMTAAE
jgi:RND family efflux transporter MFP subunit